MGSQLQNGKQQFETILGTPLVGGQVYFYAPGTETPQDTFQDEALTIPNTNPVTLDARGQAVIWGDGVYRQVLYDRFGVLIWDQIVSASVSVSDLSGSGGAALIGLPGGGTLADAFSLGLNHVVDSIAALRALNHTFYARAFVTGYYAASDGGGGAYQYDPDDTSSADDGGTIIVASDGGRWKLQIIDMTVDVKQFGAKVDGSTDDTATATSGLAWAKAKGGTLTIPAGVLMTNTLNLDGGAKTYSVIGSGKNQTILKFIDGTGTLLVDAGSGTIGYVLQGFTLDCQYSVHQNPANRDGFSIFQRSNFTIRDVHITDFLLNACLMFDTDNTAAAGYGYAQVIDCSCDGLGVGSNGFLFVNMTRCSYARVQARGLVNNDTGPGVGVQFKNRCTYCAAEDILSINNAAGFGFSGDQLGAIPGPGYNNLVNLRAINCQAGIYLTNAAQHNTGSNIYIDMDSNTSNFDAINVQQNAIGNSMQNVIVQNLPPNRAAVRASAGCFYNVFDIAVLDNTNATGVAAFFDTGSSKNRVRVRRFLNTQVTAISSVSPLVNFVTPSNNNTFECDDYPYTSFLTLASNAIALSNAINNQLVYVDTAGGAPSDTLINLVNSYQQAGQLVILRSTNDARDVTVTNTGNIELSSAGSPFVLSSRRCQLCLSWDAFSEKWIESWRVTNT